jgi:lipopolysaccharide transport system permease protein
VDGRSPRANAAAARIGDAPGGPPAGERSGRAGAITLGLADVVAYRSLVWNLVRRDLKLRYRGSLLGIGWSLVNPVLMVGLYSLVFRSVFRVQVEHYGLFVLVGLLPWNFFAQSSIASTHAVAISGHLIQRVYFPRETLPVAGVLFHFAQLLLALTVLLPALLIVSGRRPPWTAFLAAPLLLVHLLFVTGLAFALSAVAAAFRDLRHLTEVATTMLIWLTPVLYPVDIAPAAVRPFLQVNPLGAFAIAYHDVLFWGTVPELLVVANVVGSTIVALAGGHAVFRRFSPALAELT